MKDNDKNVDFDYHLLDFFVQPCVDLIKAIIDGIYRHYSWSPSNEDSNKNKEDSNT